MLEKTLICTTPAAVCSKHWPGKPFPQAIFDDALPCLSEIADTYLDSISSLGDDQLIIDKTLGNYLFPGLISMIFPNAKFIHSSRHPVATCYGCYKVLFGSGLVPFSYRLEDLASQYQDTARMLDHWKQVMPGKIHTLQYESLIAEQESQTRDLLKFCALPWEDDCLNFHSSGRAVGTASNIQVKQKLYTSAVDEWEKFRDYLGPLLSLSQ